MNRAKQCKLMLFCLFVTQNMCWLVFHRTTVWVTVLHFVNFLAVRRYFKLILILQPFIMKVSPDFFNLFWDTWSTWPQATAEQKEFINVSQSFTMTRVMNNSEAALCFVSRGVFCLDTLRFSFTQDIKSCSADGPTCAGGGTFRCLCEHVCFCARPCKCVLPSTHSLCLGRTTGQGGARSKNRVRLSLIFCTTVPQLSPCSLALVYTVRFSVRRVCVSAEHEAVRVWTVALHTQTWGWTASEAVVRVCLFSWLQHSLGVRNESLPHVVHMWRACESCWEVTAGWMTDRGLFLNKPVTIIHFTGRLSRKLLR